VDCLCFFANGTIPDDRRTLPAEIAVAWPESPNGDWWDIVPVSEDEGSFSWLRCGGCGSDLGGDRYDAVAYAGSGHKA
jgi:hypothetical protein